MIPTHDDGVVAVVVERGEEEGHGGVVVVDDDDNVGTGEVDVKMMWLELSLVLLIVRELW